MIAGTGVREPYGVAVTGLAEVREPYDVGAELGRGHKYLLPASRHLLVAARRAIGGRLDHVTAERRGVTVGTNGAVGSYYRRTTAASAPEDLSPATAPSFAVNTLSARMTGEHRLKAFSLTCTSPGVAGFEAIELGALALATGRADALVTAAMEETGAIVLVLEPSPATDSTPATGPGLFARTAYAPPGLAGTAGGRARLLADAGEIVAKARPAVVHAVTDGSPVARAVVEAVAAASGLEPLTAPAGDGGLDAMSLLAHLLRTARENALVITATAGGHYAFAAILPGVPAC